MPDEVVAMIGLWLGGLIRRRKGRLAGTVAGIALTVALLASLSAFLGQSAATMTRRAIAGVPVDWQFQLAPGNSVSAMAAKVGQAARVATLHTAGYAEVDGLEAHSGGTVQTTGPGRVLGLDTGYVRDFSGQFRLLLGRLDGVLIAQQTAANLHVGVGDTVIVHRPGLTAAEVHIDGVAELPNADSLFQAVGVPPGAAPQAPPDNVLLLPLAVWHDLFDPQAAAHHDSVHMQLHVALAHADLPGDPGAALTVVQGAAKNLEARSAGTGVLADNLAARLDAVRSDALYAKVLFLFLGTPGALMAALLTLAVAASGGGRRRRDQALLRVRGASRGQIMALAAAEAALVGIAGGVLGLVLAEWSVHALFGQHLFGRAAMWDVVAALLASLLLAQLALLLPAWRDARDRTVVAARRIIVAERAALWQRIGLDGLLLALSAMVFWQSWRTGYQVVLAPEGTPATSVEYPVFLAPALLWLGVGLLTLRLCTLGLVRGRTFLARCLRPLAGALADTAAAVLGRQHRRVTRGVGLIALAFAFATSTAVFNTTYHAQAQVDAELSNGADVTVTGTLAAPASARLAALSVLPGVSAAQPMQHRLAYVGNDLQDLYGIDAGRIVAATNMSNAYFQGNDAQATLAKLAQTPDGILVSEETVTDFQLQPGDVLTLRLQHGGDGQYRQVPFRFIGVVREFPTAPRDSFLVANTAYVARQTGADAAEIVLLRTHAAPAQVAQDAHRIVQDMPGVKVSDIAQAQRLIGSSLVAVDLGGLTRLQLMFAVLLVVGATGLVLALGLADRRRTFAVLSALGAKPRQLGAFLWSEALLLFVVGASVGIATGFGLAWMLVKLLTGVFDPPPERLSVPWHYLLTLLGAALVSMLLAVWTALRETNIPAVRRMHDL